MQDLFRSCSWNITSFARSQFPNGMNPKGIEIGIRSTELEPLGHAVAAALEEIGLTLRVNYGHEAQKYPLVFLIGSKL